MDGDAAIPHADEPAVDEVQHEAPAAQHEPHEPQEPQDQPAGRPIGFAARLAVGFEETAAVGALGAEDEPAIEQHQVVPAGGPTEGVSKSDGMQVDQVQMRCILGTEPEQQVPRMKVLVNDAGLVHPGDEPA